jgi:hypothetical protein
LNAQTNDAQDIFTGKDCSITKDKLELGVTYSSDPRTGFTGDQLELAVGDILSAAPGKQCVQDEEKTLLLR